MANKAKASSKKQQVESQGKDVDSIEGILSKLPKDTPQEVREVVAEMFFSGPLPPPSLLQHYEETLPGLAARIVAMAEKEQSARQRNNIFSFINDLLKILGSIAVSAGLIAAGVYCGLIGEPWLGGVIGTSGAIAGIMNKVVTKK